MASLLFQRIQRWRVLYFSSAYTELLGHRDSVSVMTIAGKDVFLEKGGVGRMESSDQECALAFQHPVLSPQSILPASYFRGNLVKVQTVSLELGGAWECAFMSFQQGWCA